jgi:hypothetical protein
MLMYGFVLVYNASRAAKAYAFANRTVRLHIGTMVRYTIAGAERKHYRLSDNSPHKTTSERDNVPKQNSIWSHRPSPLPL